MNIKRINEPATDTAILLCGPAVIAVDIDAPEPKSRKEVEDLKRKWAEDPDWDLENTEGFDAHREELGAFSAQEYAKWESRSQADDLAVREAIAAKIGVPADHMAVGYARTLEWRLEMMDERLADVERALSWGRK